MPDDFDDDEPDPDAGPSGHSGPPILPLDGDEPFNPLLMPENDSQSDKFHWYVLFRCFGETTRPVL